MDRYDSANPTRIHSTAVNPLHALGPLRPRALSVPETEGSASAEFPSRRFRAFLQCRKLSSAFGATNARANYRCESRRAGDFTKTLDVSTTHSCGITLRRWCRITTRSSRIKLSESGRARDYALRKIPNATQKYNHTKCPYDIVEKGNTVGDELMDELKYCVEAEK